MSLTNMVIMPGSDYQEVCDAIREKTGGIDPIKSGDMAAQIRGISSGPSTCTATIANNSDDSITIYPHYEGYYESIVIDRFESASITVPKNSAIWFNGWVPLGASVNPATAGSYKICSCGNEGIAAIYADCTVTIKNN